MMEAGSRWLIPRGLATQRDIDFTEAHGRLDDAKPESVSERALQRGYDQCGSLGAGNHFMEVQVVDRIFDESAATVMGLDEGMVCVMIHSGSRGLGYQVCDDALRKLRGVPEQYGIALPDRQLACAPVDSPAGEDYIGAMRAAANFAWCNRQLLMWQAREVFENVFGRSWHDLDMQLIYDVAHNIAKLERSHDQRRVKASLGASQGSDACFSPASPGTSTRVRFDRSTSFNSRRHGASQLGLGRPTGCNGTNLRKCMPRCGSHDESPCGGATVQGAAH